MVLILLIYPTTLRGRSKQGGQRVELRMEVWALEGFGAAYILKSF
jgi:DNA-directed RNA polymerase beta subunit